MSNKKTMQEFAEKLCKSDFENLSKSNLRSRLVVEEDWYASPFKKRFGIADNDEEKFDEAFRIVISGVGGELTKINSAISSSLLSLLFFYKLFKFADTDESPSLTLEIKGNPIEFDRAFFEVRNKCIGFPSCVDVVLQSTDKSTNKKTLLFLESKLTEYIGGVSHKETYGKSYNDLYETPIIKELLGNQEIKVNENSKGELDNQEIKVVKVEPPKGELVLECKNNDDRKYIEGIKQSICHLIGLVQGPQNVKKENSGPYYDEYKEYEKAFDEADKLVYGTILFDPLKLGVADGKKYKDLYSGIIGNNGEKIVGAIADWLISKNDRTKKSEDIKKAYVDEINKRKTIIDVLKEPLTYQDIIEKNPDYLSKLPEPIKEYYGFNES